MLRLLIAAAALLLFGVGCRADAPATPRAEQGRLDLSSVDLTGERSAFLDGAWELYWGQLLTPADFAAAPRSPDAYVPVPGAWNGLLVGDRPLPAEGYATVRLLVRLGPHADVLALYVRYMSGAYRLWVDGEPAAANGVVGTSAAMTVPSYVPTLVYLAQPGDSIELVAHVANFSHRRGGVWNRVELGPAPSLTQARLIGLAVATAQIGAIALMGLYHLGVYSLRRGDRSALYFALLCLSVAARMAATDEMPLTRAWPDLPWAAQLKLEYLTGYVGMAALTAFLGALYPAEVNRWGRRAVYAVTGLLGLFTLVAPTRLGSEIVVPYQPLVAVAIVWLLVSVGRAALRRREGARLFLAGCAVLLLTVVHDILGYNQVLFGAYLLPVGLVAMILAQSGVLARRFAAAFRRQEVLAVENEQLSDSLRQQLDEVRGSRERAVKADERARRQVAELLHGRVQPTLLVATQRLADIRAGLPDPSARAALDEIVERLDRVRDDEVRRASHLLHPSVISLGLVPALHFLTEQLGGRVRLTVTADPAVARLDDPLENQLPAELRLAAYRVAEEALGNVLRHADARAAELRLALVDAPGETPRLRLEVADDGRGFDPDQARHGLGLHAVADRASQLGGSWSVRSSPGAGTTVTAEWPLEPVPEAPLPTPG